MSRLKEFTTRGARPLPVILLADISGSMGAGGKIQALNHAVREMLETFKDEADLRAEIHVAIVTFGGSAKIHRPMGSAADTTWTDMGASGGTPMGRAFGIAQEMLEDRGVISGRAYRPTIVLASDGEPTDEWRTPLAGLLASERARKADRFALAIGADADNEALQAFLDDPEKRVFQAEEAREIRKFFQLVTMSVSSRSRSANPNSAAVIVEDDWGL